MVLLAYGKSAGSLSPLSLYKDIKWIYAFHYTFGFISVIQFP